MRLLCVRQQSGVLAKQAYAALDVNGSCYHEGFVVLEPALAFIQELQPGNRIVDDLVVAG